MSRGAARQDVLQVYIVYAPHRRVFQRDPRSVGRKASDLVQVPKQQCKDGTRASLRNERRLTLANCACTSRVYLELTT
jgi:hypothetical protein